MAVLQRHQQAGPAVRLLQLRGDVRVEVVVLRRRGRARGPEVPVAVSRPAVGVRALGQGPLALLHVAGLAAQHEFGLRQRVGGALRLRGGVAEDLQDGLGLAAVPHEAARRRGGQRPDAVDGHGVAVQRGERRADGDAHDLGRLALFLEHGLQRPDGVQRRVGRLPSRLRAHHQFVEFAELDLAAPVRVQERDQAPDLLVRRVQADLLEERLDLALVDGARAVRVDRVEGRLDVAQLLGRELRGRRAEVAQRELVRGPQRGEHLHEFIELDEAALVLVEGLGRQLEERPIVLDA